MAAIKKVAVVGAGTMGQGIAHVAALAGYDTFIFDASPGQATCAVSNIQKSFSDGVTKGRTSPADMNAAMQRLTAVGALDDLRGELVIEAAVERLDVKQSLLAKLEKILPGAILATN